jgi:hypothetical protein
LYSRTFEQTHITEDLAKVFDIRLFNLVNETNLFKEDKKWQNIDIIISEEEKRLSTKLRIVNLISKKKRSNSFKFAITRKIFGNNLIVPRTRDAHFLDQIKKEIVFRMNSFVTNYQIISYLYVPFLARVVTNKRKNQMTRNQQIIELLEEFDYLIIQGIGTEQYIEIIINSMKGTKTKTILIIDNWDNLTSKGSYIVNPDIITVMGQDDIKNAISVHNFSSNQVWPIGLPKFEQVKKIKSMKTNKILIYYIGFSVPHDEVEIINRLYLAIKNNFPYNEFTFTYRPHPLQLARYHKKAINRDVLVEIESRKQLPNLDQTYGKILGEASLIIGPPTTLILEAALINKHILIDLTKDKLYKTSSGRAAKKYKHIKDLEKMMPEICCKNAKILEQKMLHLIKSNFPQIECNENLSNLITFDDTKYVDKLTKRITQDFEYRKSNSL